MHTLSRMILICVCAASATACVRPLSPSIHATTAPVASDQGAPAVCQGLPVDSLAISLNGIGLHRGALYDDPPSLREHMRTGRNAVEIEMRIVDMELVLAVDHLVRVVLLDSSSGRSYQHERPELRVALTATVWGCSRADRECEPPADMSSELSTRFPYEAGTTGAPSTLTATLLVNGELAIAGERCDERCREALAEAARRALRDGRNEVVVEWKQDARTFAEHSPTGFEYPKKLILAAFGATERLVTFRSAAISARFSVEVCGVGDVSCAGR